MREARLTLQQAELDRRMTKADRIPDVSLAVSYISNFNIDVLPTNLATVGVQREVGAVRLGPQEAASWRRRPTPSSRRASASATSRIAPCSRSTAASARSPRSGRCSTWRGWRRRAAREKLRVKTNQYQVQAALLPDVLQVRAELADTDDRYQQALLDFWTAKADYDLAVGEEVLR